MEPSISRLARRSTAVNCGEAMVRPVERSCGRTFGQVPNRRLHMHLDVRRDASYYASSAEFVGEFWFGELAKSVIQSDFRGSKLAEAIRLSEGEFDLVV